MNYREQAMHHLRELMKVDAKIDKYRAEARKDLLREANGRRQAIAPLLLEDRLAKKLGGESWFLDLVGDRNFHTARATMYATLATMEALTLQVDPR